MNFDEIMNKSIEAVLKKELDKMTWISKINEKQFNDCNKLVSADFIKNKHNISDEVILDFIFHNRAFCDDYFLDGHNYDERNFDFSNINKYIYKDLIYSEFQDYEYDMFKNNNNISSQEFRDFLRCSLEDKDVSYLEALKEFLSDSISHNIELWKFIDSNGSRFYNDLITRIEKMNIESKLSKEDINSIDLNKNIKKRL